MRLWNMIVGRGLGSVLDQLAGKLFTGLVKSKAFRTTVIETEKAVIKGIRFAGNPEKETREFHRREQEAVDYLAQKAKQAATESIKKSSAPKTPPPPPPPSNTTFTGYQPESEWSRWYKTKKYEAGVLKQKWFG
jgi:hypothetical protein